MGFKQNNVGLGVGLAGAVGAGAWAFLRARKTERSAAGPDSGLDFRAIWRILLKTSSGAAAGFVVGYVGGTIGQELVTAKRAGRPYSSVLSRQGLKDAFWETPVPPAKPTPPVMKPRPAEPSATAGTEVTDVEVLAAESTPADSGPGPAAAPIGPIMSDFPVEQGLPWTHPREVADVLSQASSGRFSPSDVSALIGQIATSGLPPDLQEVTRHYLCFPTNPSLRALPALDLDHERIKALLNEATNAVKGHYGADAANRATALHPITKLANALHEESTIAGLRQLRDLTATLGGHINPTHRIGPEAQRLWTDLIHRTGIGNRRQLPPGT